MATRRAPTKTWVAKEGDFYIGRYPAVAFHSGNTLSGVFGTATSGVAFSAACKNITVTPPETSWEKQDLLGKDSNTFQNQLLDEKPVGLATVTATLVVGEDEMIEDYVMSGTVASKPTGYTRYQIGNTVTNGVIACVAVKNTDDSNYVAFGLQDGRVTKYGDVRISGPDSHWEQDITIICLAKNFYYEFKD